MISESDGISTALSWAQTAELCIDGYPDELRVMTGGILLLYHSNLFSVRDGSMTEIAKRRARRLNEASGHLVVDS